jgi:hypothetical protein
MGGLGNLMFQIATIEYLGYKHKIKTGYWNLNSQINYLDNDNDHNSSLKHANDYLEMFENFKWPFIDQPPGGFYNFKEVPLHYEPFNVINDTTYSGMFQSEKYFPDRNFILNLFKPSKKIVHKLKKYDNILEGSTCSIHIRRGDYLKRQYNTYPLDINYFQRAVDLIGNVDRYLIFSDDIKWCKEIFLMENTIFIENEKDYVELFLQSKCTHNIISNSTFSWWGAYLNKNPHKKIIAPKAWFEPNMKNDIVPDYWVSI